jgi:hypothetical protein
MKQGIEVTQLDKASRRRVPPMIRVVEPVAPDGVFTRAILIHHAILV